MKRRQSPGELTDKEWGLVKEVIEKRKSPRGRKPKYGKREMLNAVFYLMRSGCSWRLLPDDYPPWQAVYSQFMRWKKDKIFEKLNEQVRGNLRHMMEGKKLKGGKGISQLTRKGCC